MLTPRWSTIHGGGQRIDFVITGTHAKHFSWCSRLITESERHVLGRYAHSVQSHSELRVKEKKKGREHSLLETTHQISSSSILESGWILRVGSGGSAPPRGCSCCYLFLFLMFFPCSRGGELISFLMVGHECLRQMNYAFLPYVISCRPGNTEPFGDVKTNYLPAAAQTE